MELLDRYLHAVGANLPPRKRDDILRELRANILEGVEEREVAAGRPLTLEEEEAVLRQYGHPAVVGMRYWPKQYLIGPSVFPYYLYGLKTVVPIALLVYGVANAIGLAARSFTSLRVIDVLLGVPGVIFSVAAWITVVFVVVEYVQAHWPAKIHLFDQWSPRTLPAVPSPSQYVPWKARFELFAGSLALAWFLLIPHFPILAIGPVAGQLRYINLAPEWQTFYWAFVALMFVQWLADLGCVLRPRLRFLRPAIGLVGRAGFAVLFALMMRVPTYVWLSEAGRGLTQAQELVNALNMALRIGLRAMVVIFIVTIVVDLARMIFGGRATSESLPFNGGLEH